MAHHKSAMAAPTLDLTRGAVPNEPELNHAFFLHLLATNPSAVIPDGKSLLSMMSTLSRPHETKEHDSESLHDRVESLVHQAFWDEGIESLSSPLPSVVLARLSLFYQDLYEALTPLMPKSSSILTLLSSPMSPTSSPLGSARAHLHEVIQSLKTRCAPVRDYALDDLMRSLQLNVPASELPGLIVSTIKGVLTLSEVMQDDLHQFTMGTLSEAELSSIIRQQAKIQEREIVESIWGSKDNVRELWAQWVHPNGTEGAWINRLLKSIASPEAVACTWPSHPESQPVAANPNPIPPTFVFTTPALIYVQNLLQAIIIAAALRSLVRLSPLPTPPLANDGSDFMQRVCSLLRAEIESDVQDSAKLINLSDEVLRARRSFSTDNKPITPAEEANLRAAVERTLQPTDPVYKLLQKRLLDALGQRAVSLYSNALRVIRPRVVPEHMRTGRGEKSRVDNSADPEYYFQPHDDLRAVKGLEDPVLQAAISEVFRKFMETVTWTQSVWGDIVDN